MYSLNLFDLILNLFAMKTISYILLFGVFIAVSCSDKDDPEPTWMSETDITTQLRGDLESGKSVELPQGTFFVSESITIENYPGGTIRGAGIDQTIIETAPNFKAAPTDLMGDEYAGYENAHIFYLEHTKGDISISDMTIRVTGATPAMEHTNPLTGTSTNIDNVITIGGGGTTVRFENLHIDGEFVGNIPGTYNGYNITWALIASAWLQDSPINYDVVNCTIEGVGQVALEYWIPRGGVANISNITIKDSNIGVWVGQWESDGYDTECEVTVEGSDFVNITTDAIKYTGITKHCFQNNTLDGEPMTDDCNLN